MTRHRNFSTFLGRTPRGAVMSAICAILIVLLAAHLSAARLTLRPAFFRTDPLHVRQHTPLHPVRQNHFRVVNNSRPSLSPHPAATSPLPIH